MKTYKVTLDLEVEANNAEEAQENALLESSQHDFTGHIEVTPIIENAARIFLLTVTLCEDEHEHNDHALIEANSQEEAERIANKQVEFDNEHGNDDDGSYFAYGEGDVEVVVDEVREITPEEAETLRKLSLAYFLNRKSTI
jgi:hypothetical protein